MGREAIEGDGNFTLILYRVDRQLTEYDGVYGEASKDGIRYLPPVELKVIPIMFFYIIRNNCSMTTIYFRNITNL